MIHRANIGWQIWAAGFALVAGAGAALGACGLPGATSDPSSMTGSGGEASSSSRGPSSSSGHHGTGGMGGTTAVAGGGGGAAGSTSSSTSSSASVGGGQGGSAASSSSTGPTRSCTDEYGSAPGFVLCVETATTCDFNLDTNAGQTSCDATCGALGGGCIQAFDNNGPCDLFSNTNVACNDSHYGTTLCRCTHF